MILGIIGLQLMLDLGGRRREMLTSTPLICTKSLSGGGGTPAVK